MSSTEQRLVRTVTFVGAFAGFLVGVLAGMVLYGDQLLLPLAPALLLTAAGAVLAPAVHGVLHGAPARGRDVVDEERLERRMAAHRAMAELG